MKIGIYQSYWGRVGGGQRYVAVVAELLARTHDVEIVHHFVGFDPKAVEEPMQVDLSNVAFRHVPTIVRPNWPTNNPRQRLRLERELGREISQPYDLFIDSSDIPPFFNHAQCGALLIHFPLVSFEQYHGRQTDAWRSRNMPARWLTGAYHQWEWRQRFASYDQCIVNSEFTKQWAKRLWGVDASILFPPLREGLVAQSKEKAILSIGAFRAAQHKKQFVMLDAFKALCDAGLQDWRYVMLGATGPADADREYLRDLKQAATGYPIEMLPDASGGELKSRLEASAILWHSMGYGVDTTLDPGRMEHFGMVAAEALAAGCVPVVFKGGGLPEIVKHGTTGFLWSTAAELLQQTQLLIRNEVECSRMSAEAIADAERFAGPAFERRLNTVLKPLLVPSPSARAYQ